MGGKFICFLDINYGHRWSSSVLGKIYPICIENKNFLIHFPKKPKDFPKLEPLDPPNVVEKYKQGDEPIYFGSCISSPKGDCIIEKVVITADVDDNESAAQLAINMDAKITFYTQQFLKYIRIVSNCIEPRGGVERKNFAHYNYDTGDTSTHLDPHSVHNITAVLFGNEYNAPGNKTVVEALKLLAHNTQIPAPYDYYLDAVEAYETGDHRKAVLDAATASEMCVTDEIRRILHEKDGDWNLDRILENYQGLNKKFEFLKAINGSTENICISNIGTPRNKAIHAGANIDAACAVSALDESRKVINRYLQFW